MDDEHDDEDGTTETTTKVGRSARLRGFDDEKDDESRMMYTTTKVGRRTRHGNKMTNTTTKGRMTDTTTTKGRATKGAEYGKKEKRGDTNRKDGRKHVHLGVEIEKSQLYS